MYSVFVILYVVGSLTIPMVLNVIFAFCPCLVGWELKYMDKYVGLFF